MLAVWVKFGQGFTTLYLVFRTRRGEREVLSGSFLSIGRLEGVLKELWVYRRYAEMTGNLVSLESNSALVDGVAVMSEKQARAWILLGSRGFVGRVIIEMINLPTTSESIRVVVERVPGSWVVDKPLLIPEVVVDSVTRIEQGVLRLALDWRSSLDAYCITLDFAETGGQARL